MDDRFEDLVNLYLDKEIGRQELDELKRAIKDNLVRRQQFERACKLHQAARKALAERSSQGEHKPRGGVVASASSSRLPSPQKRHASLDAAHAQAHVNARVPTMVARQEKEGAAASISIKTASKKGKSAAGRSGSTQKMHRRSQAVLFWSSVIGIAATVLFMLNPAARNPDAPMPVDATPHYNFGSNAQDGGAAGLSPMPAEDAIRARVYASALAEGTVSQSFLMEGMGEATPNGGGASHSTLYSNSRILLGSSSWAGEKWDLGPAPASTSLAPSLAPQPPLLEQSFPPAGSGNMAPTMDVGRSGKDLSNHPLNNRTGP
jgi:hypothetical protein